MKQQHIFQIIFIINLFSYVNCLSQKVSVNSALSTNSSIKIKAFYQNKTPTVIWEKRFGGNDFDELTSIIPISNKGYLIAGNSFSNISGDKTQVSWGYDDFWVIKTDTSGNKVWDKRYGGTNEDKLLTVIDMQNGNFLLAGNSSSNATGDKTENSRGGYDFWIVKIDSSGNKIWDKRFGGNSFDYLTSITTNRDGSILLGGSSFSSISGDKSQNTHGGFDFWIVKIDMNGNKIWDKTFGGSDFDYLTAVIPIDQNNFLLSGYSKSSISGDKTQINKGESDFWIVKIDNNGNKIWDKSYGGSNEDKLYSIVPTSDGGFLLGGQSSSDISGDKTQLSKGGSDFWVIKVDINGNKIWDKSYGGIKDESLNSMFALGNDGFLLGGGSLSSSSADRTQNSQGNSDFWFLKIDTLGNKIWDKSLGGRSFDKIACLKKINDQFIIAGNSFSNISGDKNEQSQGNCDFWVVNVKPESISSICGGYPITLTASGCSGITTWSTGATGATITTNPLQTTNITATCTINNTISPVSNTISIIRPSAPNVQSITPESICLGSRVTLTTRNNTTGTISWSNGMVGDSLRLMPNYPGSQEYTATNTISGCTSTTSPPITITIKAIPPQPVISKSTDNTICPGQSVLLTVNNCVGSVSWLPSGNGNRLVVSPNTTKTYTAVCTATNSCVNSNTSTVSVDPNQMYSIKSGNWNDSTVWSCGRIPTLLDSIKISFGHTISINTLNNQAKQVNIEGILNYSIDNSKLSLNR